MLVCGATFDDIVSPFAELDIDEHDDPDVFDLDDSDDESEELDAEYH